METVDSLQSYFEYILQKIYGNDYQKDYIEHVPKWVEWLRDNAWITTRTHLKTMFDHDDEECKRILQKIKMPLIVQLVVARDMKNNNEMDYNHNNHKQYVKIGEVLKLVEEMKFVKDEGKE